MVEEKHYAEPGILGEQGRIYSGQGTIRAPASDRELVKYSYLVVHAQESLRLLDLRITTDAGIDFRHLHELFGAIGGDLHINVALELLCGPGEPAGE